MKIISLRYFDSNLLLIFGPATFNLIRAAIKNDFKSRKFGKFKFYIYYAMSTKIPINHAKPTKKLIVTNYQARIET